MTRVRSCLHRRLGGPAAAGLLALAGLVPATGHAITKCVGAGGEVSYGDQACSGSAKASTLEIAADRAAPVVGRDQRREAVPQRGLPSGTGWRLSQDWYRHSDGRRTAIISCSPTVSVGLIRKPPVEHRIVTTVTGREVFLSVEDAARKACPAALKVK